jgi:hypothetical protein
MKKLSFCHEFLFNSQLNIQGPGLVVVVIAKWVATTHQRYTFRYCVWIFKILLIFILFCIQETAATKGLQQVLWLYGDDHQLTEVGTMNIMMLFINENGGKIKFF